MAAMCCNLIIFAHFLLMCTYASFIFVNESYIFTTARDYCKEIIGTDLASIHTTEEHMLANNSIPDGFNGGFWIGLHRMSGHNQNWTWSDGSVWDYGRNLNGGVYPWGTNQPSNGGETRNEQCATIRIDWGGRWNDLNCVKDPLPFLCKRYTMKSVHPTAEPTSDPITIHPTTIHPSTLPTSNPSTLPTSNPSTIPTSDPTSTHPTEMPSSSPTISDAESIDNNTASSNSHATILIVVGCTLLFVVFAFCAFIVYKMVMEERKKNRYLVDAVMPAKMEQNNHSRRLSSKSADFPVVTADNKNPGQISNDEEEWNPEYAKIKKWLEEIVFLPQYYEQFILNGFDSMAFIKEIKSKEELRQIDIVLLGHQIKIMTEIHKLREPEDETEGNTTGDVIEGIDRCKTFEVIGDDDQNHHQTTNGNEL